MYIILEYTGQGSDIKYYGPYSKEELELKLKFYNVEADSNTWIYNGHVYKIAILNP